MFTRPRPSFGAVLNSDLSWRSRILSAPHFPNGFAGPQIDLARPRSWTNNGVTRVASPHEVGAGFVVASTQYMVTTDSVPNPRTAGITVLMLVSPTSSAPGTQRSMFCLADALDTTTLFYVYQSDTGFLGMFYRDQAGGSASIVSPHQMLASRWYAIAARTNGPDAHSVRILRTNTTSASSISASYTVPTKMTIGANNRDTISVPFDGRIGQVLVVQGALTDAEVDAWVADPCSVYEPEYLYIPRAAASGFRAAWARQRSAVIGAGVR
jgi:hypothetical protein